MKRRQFLLSTLGAASLDVLAAKRAKGADRHPGFEGVDALALSSFIASLKILATDRTPAKVMAPFSSFDHVGKLERWVESGGATFIIGGKKISNGVFYPAYDAASGKLASPLRISAASLVFVPSTVTLGDLQTIFGNWYRDPPDGVKASLAMAYFNARLIAPAATYFLIAGTKEGFTTQLHPDSPVDEFGPSWSDTRYQPHDRPF